MQGAGFGALKEGREAKRGARLRRARSSTSPAQRLARGALLVRNQWIDARVREALIKRKKRVCKRAWPSSLLFRKDLSCAYWFGGNFGVTLTNTSAAKVTPLFPGCLGRESLSRSSQ